MRLQLTSKSFVFLPRFAFQAVKNNWWNIYENYKFTKINFIYLLYLELMIIRFLTSSFPAFRWSFLNPPASPASSSLAQDFISIFYSYSKCIIKFIFLLIQLSARMHSLFSSAVRFSRKKLQLLNDMALGMEWRRSWKYRVCPIENWRREGSGS